MGCLDHTRAAEADTSAAAAAVPPPSLQYRWKVASHHLPLLRRGGDPPGPVCGRHAHHRIERGRVLRLVAQLRDVAGTGAQQRSLLDRVVKCLAVPEQVAEGVLVCMIPFRSL